MTENNSGGSILSFENVVRPQEIISLYSGESDPLLAWDKIQLTAAARLIRYFFGKEWYSLVLQRIDDANILNNPRYRRYLRSKQTPIHPLTKFFWTGAPEDLVRIVSLGIALKTLGFESGETNLNAKIDELRSGSFLKAYFELKTAEAYIRGGFEVKFLTPNQNSKSPDLLLRKEGIETFLECKKRSAISTTSLDTKVGGVLDRLRDANSQIGAVGELGIVCIEVEDNLNYDSPEIKSYSEAIRQELAILPRIFCVMLNWEKIIKRKERVHLVTFGRGIPNQSLKLSFPVKLFCDPSNFAPSSPPSIISDINIPLALLLDE